MKPKPTLIALMVTLPFFWPASSYAEYLLCTKPSPPFCLDQFGDFDEWSFQRCRGEVELYVQDVQHFQQCVIMEADRINSDAQFEAQRVVERFNCKAQGGSFCP